MYSILAIVTLIAVLISSSTLAAIHPIKVLAIRHDNIMKSSDSGGGRSDRSGSNKDNGKSDNGNGKTSNNNDNGGTGGSGGGIDSSGGGEVKSPLEKNINTGGRLRGCGGGVSVAAEGMCPRLILKPTPTPTPTPTPKPTPTPTPKPIIFPPTIFKTKIEIINNIHFVIRNHQTQLSSMTSAEDIELVDCVNALLHHDKMLFPQCDRDVSSNLANHIYNNNNVALQLAIDYLQARGII